MDREPEQQSGRGGLGWVGMMVSATILYVLSLGPVGALTQHNAAATNIARAFYYPVVWLDNHTPLKVPIEAYCNLWGVH